MAYFFSETHDNTNMLVHPIDPVYSKESKVLILGSFPSVKSRADMFYYAHPQNRFWKVIASVAAKEVPTTTEEKKNLILKSGLALWDVVKSCEITGSSDSSLKIISANDIIPILHEAPIKAVFTNGAKAHALYRRYILPVAGIEDIPLPSTSPANAAWSLERLKDAWLQAIGKYLCDSV